MAIRTNKTKDRKNAELGKYQTIILILIKIAFIHSYIAVSDFSYLKVNEKNFSYFITVNIKKRIHGLFLNQIKIKIS